MYRNSILLDIGGPTRIYALSYERILQNYKLHFLVGRVGLAYIPRQRQFDLIRIPIIINFNFANIDGHHFEGGIGQQFELVLDNQNSGSNTNALWTIFNLGYRYRPQDATFNFRMTYTPLWNLLQFDKEKVLLFDGSEYIHMGGISFGWNF